MKLLPFVRARLAVPTLGRFPEDDKVEVLDADKVRFTPASHGKILITLSMV
jgi:hypothetical protein